jgi:hypothetical protein
MIMGEWKDEAIRIAREQSDANRLQETLIQQKVNAAHREAFRQKWPNQCEHILRLIAERLQQALRKDAEVCLPPRDIDHLSAAMYHVYLIHREVTATDQD